MKLTKLRWS